jgi:hypothetical protein
MSHRDITQFEDDFSKAIRDAGYILNAPDAACYKIRIPKKVATIKLCNALVFDIDDTMSWQRPTDEQIKNLKDLFCIEVIPYEDN